MTSHKINNVYISAWILQKIGEIVLLQHIDRLFNIFHLVTHSKKNIFNVWLK